MTYSMTRKLYKTLEEVRDSGNKITKRLTKKEIIALINSTFHLKGTVENIEID